MCAEKEALRSDIYFSSHGLRFAQSLYHAEKDTVKLALQFNCVCLHFILLPVVKFCFSFFQTGELQPRLRTPATEHIRPLRITRPFHRLSVERLNRLPAGWLNRRYPYQSFLRRHFRRLPEKADHPDSDRRNCPPRRSRHLPIRHAVKHSLQA